MNYRKNETVKPYAIKFRSRMEESNQVFDHISNCLTRMQGSSNCCRTNTNHYADKGYQS